jgi:hypothetical protein
VPPSGTGPSPRACGLSGPTRRAIQTAQETSSTRTTRRSAPGPEAFVLLASNRPSHEHGVKSADGVAT